MQIDLDDTDTRKSTRKTRRATKRTTQISALAKQASDLVAKQGELSDANNDTDGSYIFIQGVGNVFHPSP